MSTQNDVFNVLVATSVETSAGTTLAGLNVGEIGVFNADTNLTIAAGTTPKNIYLAVKTAGGDIVRSAGQHIQAKGIRALNVKNYTAGQAMKFVLKDYTVECGNQYGVKLELRNQEIYRTQGYNQFSKSFVVSATDCGDCGDANIDANIITQKLLVEVANESSGLIEAVAIARQALTAATHGVAADLAAGDELADGDMEAILAYNALQSDVADYVYTDIEFTTISVNNKDFSAVPLKYYNPIETVVIPSKIGSTGNCSGTLEVTQEAVITQGSGIEVKYKEYLAKGFEEDVYRVSDLNGVANDVTFTASVATNYDQLDLTYENKSRGSFLEYQHDLNTTVAIPTGATMASLTAILDDFVA